jgi:hypothetical protein
MNPILAKTTDFTVKYATESLIEALAYTDEDFYIDIEHANLLSNEEQKELILYSNLFFCIIVWSRKNKKKPSTVFLPKSLGGDFDLISYEVRYLFLRILSIPFDKDNLKEEHYKALQDISDCIFVKMPMRINNLGEHILKERMKLYN